MQVFLLFRSICNNSEKFYILELNGRCETHHHCITGTFKDSNLTGKSKVDCVDGKQNYFVNI